MIGPRFGLWIRPKIDLLGLACGVRQGGLGPCKKTRLLHRLSSGNGAGPRAGSGTNTLQKNLQTDVVVLMMSLDENQSEIDHINIL